METSDQVLFTSDPVQMLQMNDQFDHFPVFNNPLSYYEPESATPSSDQSQSLNNTIEYASSSFDTKSLDLLSELAQKEIRELDTKELKKLKAWRADKKFGDFVEGTRIMPCKAFLSNEKWHSYLDDHEIFVLRDLAEDIWSRSGLTIGLIIDLNRSLDYYNFVEDQKTSHLLSKTNYLKFKLENAEVPDDKVVEDVFMMLSETQRRGEVVVIHCFNGINRTGYVVADFLCRYLGISGEEAIARFEKARSHKIEHACMPRKLREKYPSKTLDESL